MLRILILLAITTTQIAQAAQDEDTKNYYRAYNICSPTAQTQTMNSCNYVRLVENNYIACMNKNGYGESDEINPKHYKTKYLTTHQACTNSANSQAQRQCNYGPIYQDFYNKCMAEHGFNAQGERKSQAGTPAQEEDTDQKKKYRRTDEGESPLAKFFESIL